MDEVGALSDSCHMQIQINIQSRLIWRGGGGANMGKRIAVRSKQDWSEISVGRLKSPPVLTSGFIWLNLTCSILQK